MTDIITTLKDSSVLYEDKITAWKAITTPDIAIKFAVAAAESVLHIYESAYPNDTRPRDGIEAAKRYPNIDADAAANAAADVADAAANAAANAAHAAANAAYAATNAAYAHATDATAAKVTQQQKNIDILISLYKPKMRVWTERRVV